MPLGGGGWLEGQKGKGDLGAEGWHMYRSQEKGVKQRSEGGKEELEMTRERGTYHLLHKGA